MAAVIDLRTGSAVPVTGEPSPHDAPRPRLSVIEGGRSATMLRRRRVYLRRRLTVALGVIVAACVVVTGLSTVADALFAPPGAGAGATAVHRVERGDTLWAIAGQVDPSADRRDVVDRIVELNSSGVGFSPEQPLRVGQELLLPAPRT